MNFSNIYLINFLTFLFLVIYILHLFIMYIKINALVYCFIFKFNIYTKITSLFFKKNQNFNKIIIYLSQNYYSFF